MTTIPTAGGTIDTADLGRTLVHEHVFVLGEELRQNYAAWDEQARVDDAVAKLNELKRLGIDTILDPTVIGLGRYIPRIATIAARADLNIVVATGLYTYNELPFQFHYTGPGTMLGGPEPLTALFVGDLTDGIAGTGIKAAFLKCAIEEPGLTPGVERAMRAVGQASAQTGAPITVHTNPHTESGLIAQRVLAEEGVDLGRVILGHSGDCADVDHLSALADAGSYLGMDRFGLDLLAPFDQRVDTVVELVRRGYAERIVISHDAACMIDWFPDGMVPQMAPNWHYRHISEDVLPALRERGVSDADIDSILIANPRRYFDGS